MDRECRPTLHQGLACMQAHEEDFSSKLPRAGSASMTAVTCSEGGGGTDEQVLGDRGILRVQDPWAKMVTNYLGFEMPVLEAGLLLQKIAVALTFIT